MAPGTVIVVCLAVECFIATLNLCARLWIEVPPVIPNKRGTVTPVTVAIVVVRLPITVNKRIFDRLPVLEILKLSAYHSNVRVRGISQINRTRLILSL